ncbi:hypothetical protein pdam_00012907 [Pocillopora damicornis]|uniref:Uncharacterized protein n=1 Tax=Pocillopora damicornis TaxID=46731 RepID=A0A3M6U0Q6_POCDA|nr:hypothetical protein pdam_00012907 [Pocillopora damicornis]
MVTRIDHSNWPLKTRVSNLQRPKSVCILPMHPLKTDVYTTSARVSKALEYTQDKRGYIFTRMPQEKLTVSNIRTTISPSRSLSRTSLYTTPQTPSRLTPDTSSMRNTKRALDAGSSMSTLRSQTTESGSISLVPGVFQGRNPRPRIFVRYRQLSSEERVIEWLYKYCTHPLKTLPLL